MTIFLSWGLYSVHDCRGRRTRDDHRSKGQPGRAFSLLGLVRKLIDYGRQLADALQRQGTAALERHASHFATIDVALILARIARGLRIAAALETRLATMKREPRPSPLPMPRPPRPARPALPRPDAAVRRLPDLPTDEEIAALLRRKPIGAVLADICRDLGILPRHALWQELNLAISTYGGSFVRLMLEILDRTLPLPAAALAPSPRRRTAAARTGTGPP